MIETIMKKIGYVKLPKGSEIVTVNSDSYNMLLEIQRAFLEGKDLFIDFVKKTQSQKMYKKVDKRRKCILEVNWK